MSSEPKNNEAPKKAPKKVCSITIVLPAWMGADKILDRYKKSLAEAVPKLQEMRANLEQKIAELDDGNSIVGSIYKLNQMIIQERLERLQSDEVVLEILASLAEFYDNTRLTVLHLEDEMSKLPIKQRRKLNKVTRELAEKIETTLRPIKEAFEASESLFDEGTEEQIGDIPPHRLWN